MLPSSGETAATWGAQSLPTFPCYCPSPTAFSDCFPEPPSPGQLTADMCGAVHLFTGCGDSEGQEP